MKGVKGASSLSRVVLDTNILVSALFWQGNEREILRKCRAGDVCSITSPQILEELEGVLLRKFKVPKEKVDMYVREVLLFSEIVFPKGGIAAVKEHPADDLILETGILGKADLIVTGDKHLLELKRYENMEIRKAGSWG